MAKSSGKSSAFRTGGAPVPKMQAVRPGGGGWEQTRLADSHEAARQRRLCDIAIRIRFRWFRRLTGRKPRQFVGRYIGWR